MKLRIYLDTSVFLACYDDGMPDRKAWSIDYWSHADRFLNATSALTREELLNATGRDLRDKLDNHVRKLVVHEISSEMRELARWYVEVGVFSPLFWTDALHIAACVLTKQQIFLSWDFKRLVNRRVRFLVNETNASADLPRIDILPPPEL